MQLQQVYSILVETQQSLHSESATSADFEEAFNQELKQRIDKVFLDQMVGDKQYYLQIFFMNYFKKVNKLPFTNKEALLLSNRDGKSLIIEKKAEGNEERIPEIFSIYEGNVFLKTLIKLLNAKILSSESTPDSTKFLTDYVTYSLIPSLYLMFIESKSFNLFCNLICQLKKSYEDKTISDPFHYTLSRSLFVSPLFLKFIHQTIYPNIKYIYESHFPINYEQYRTSSQEKMLESFKSNLCFIPSYIPKFLREVKDTKNFLVESLFKPMFENPEQFLIIDIYHTDYDDIINEIKNILQLIFTPNLIDNISQIIDSCNESEKSLFVKEKINDNDDKITIYDRVINSIDIKVFSLINEIIDQKESKTIDLFSILNNDDQLKFYKTQFYGEKEKVNEIIYKRTGASDNDYWMHFRKLLKEAPPLPTNYSNFDPDEEITLSKFLEMTEELLVNTGDPFKYIESIYSYNQFKDNFKFNEINNQKKITKKMKALILKHDEQEKATKVFVKSRNDLNLLSFKKITTIELIQELYCTVVTKNIPFPNDLPNPNANIKSILDVLANPLKYITSFQSYFNIQGTISKKHFADCYNIYYKVWYNRYFHSLNFSNYLSYRRDLIKYDEIAQSVFNKYHSKIIENAVKSKAVKKAINHLDMFTDYFLEFNRAFENNDNPLNKLQSFYNAQSHALGYLTNKFNADAEDDYTPLRNIMISIANPPHFISNMVYLREYACQGQPDDLTDAYRRFHGAFLLMFEEVHNDTFAYNPFYFYVRTHRRVLNIFISGSDSNSIINLVNYFIDSYQNSQYKYLVKDYVKPELFDMNSLNKVSINFDQFTDAEIDKTYSATFCVIANIYFGNNIKLTADSNPDAKVAFYAYKASNKHVNRNIAWLQKQETDDFVNSRDIPNNLKFVLHESDESVSELRLKDVQSFDVKQIGSIILPLLNQL